MFTVYKHISPSRKVYIGITSQNPVKRWNNGHGYRRNEYFYRAILKYGWDNFTHEILFTGLTKEEAESKEIELIKLYDSTNCERGYNITNGGECIGKHSEESKRKMSVGHKGKLVSAQTLKKMSNSHVVRKIAQMDDNGNVIAIWNGCKTAGKALCIPYQNISECVKHKRKRAAGFVWRYVDELTKPVLQV